MEDTMTENKPLTASHNPLSFGEDVERFFNRAMRGWPMNWRWSGDDVAGGQPRALRVFDHVPKVEVKENGKTYTVSVELPGLDEKDVKVEVEDDVLSISGEKKVERSDEKTHFSERSYGSFTRAFTLPSDADGKAVEAQFAKGELNISIPKTAAATPRVKQVAIKAG
jgi:HSP20 family protein